MVDSSYQQQEQQSSPHRRHRRHQTTSSSSAVVENNNCCNNENGISSVAAAAAASAHHHQQPQHNIIPDIHTATTFPRENKTTIKKQQEQEDHTTTTGSIRRRTKKRKRRRLQHILLLISTVVLFSCYSISKSWNYIIISFSPYYDSILDHSASEAAAAGILPIYKQSQKSSVVVTRTRRVTITSAADDETTTILPVLVVPVRVMQPITFQRRRGKPNYGGLDYITRQDRRYEHNNSNTTTTNSTENQQQDDFDFATIPRTIWVQEEEIRYSKFKTKQLRYIDKRLGKYDVSPTSPERFEHYDELTRPSSDGCYRPKWSYVSYPNCNNFHEQHITIERSRATVSNNNNQQYNVRYLGHGYFRDVLMVKDVIVEDQDQEEQSSSVGALKMNRMYERRGYNNYAYAQTQMEALAMIHTHSSNRTMDIYGYCGTSTFIEPGTPLKQHYISPYEYNEIIDPDDLEYTQKQKGGIVSMNSHKYTTRDKLEIAIAMAESIAELHGNKQGIIINHDLNYDQFLYSKNDGLLKMSDLNKARVLYWNPTTSKYCTLYSGQYGLRRAPEEVHHGPTDNHIDESADVYTFGMMLYTLLTGLRPHYHVRKEDGVDVNLKGTLPYIDPRYRQQSNTTASSSIIERRFVEIIERMYKFKPSDRASIFDVVEHLRETSRLVVAAAAAPARDGDGRGAGSVRGGNHTSSSYHHHHHHHHQQ